MAINVDKEKKEISISLNKKFYDLEALKETLSDFNDVCKGEIKENLERINISLTTNNEDFDVLGQEFCNYALGLMKNRSLV